MMDAEKVFDKVVSCLALELPESVWADVSGKYQSLKQENAALRSRIAALEGVIGDVPEHFTQVVYGEYNENAFANGSYNLDMIGDDLFLSSLLKKHGVSL